MQQFAKTFKQLRKVNKNTSQRLNKNTQLFKVSTLFALKSISESSNIFYFNISSTELHFLYQGTTPGIGTRFPPLIFKTNSPSGVFTSKSSPLMARPFSSKTKALSSWPNGLLGKVNELNLGISSPCFFLNLCGYIDLIIFLLIFSILFWVFDFWNFLNDVRSPVLAKHATSYMLFLGSKVWAIFFDPLSGVSKVWLFNPPVVVFRLFSETQIKNLQQLTGFFSG